MAPARKPNWQNSTDSPAASQFSDQKCLFGHLLYLTQAELTRTKTGFKKTWSFSRAKVGFDFARRVFGLGEKQSVRNLQQPNVHQRRKVLFSLFNLLFLRLLFPCWTHVKGTLLRRVWFKRFPTTRGWKQMKMLEICLKLVGCKSKKGLSSSSSCYLEGKNDDLFLLKLGLPVYFWSKQTDIRKRDKVWPHNGNDFWTVETQEWGGESRE